MNKVKAKKISKKQKPSWHAIVWDMNSNAIRHLDVAPVFIDALKKVSKSDRPKTWEALSELLDNEARYMFWARCEYEVIISSWPKGHSEKKIDVYSQLKLNWDAFVDVFWNYLNIKSK